MAAVSCRWQRRASSAMTRRQRAHRLSIPADGPGRGPVGACGDGRDSAVP
jgi:hypothetical protein